MKLFKKAFSILLTAIMITSCIPLSEIIVAAAQPANLTSIQYTLDNNTDGFAGGTVTIKAPSSNIGMDCVMYWADANDKPLSEFTHLTPFKITSTTTQFKMYENTIIPEGAKKLIAYTSNGGSFSSGHVSVSLPDGAAYEIDDSKFIYEFQMVSDTHIMADWEGYNNKFINFLNDVATYSPKSSGIFVCGDFTNDGTAEQFDKALSLYKSVDGIPKMTVSFGNHDWRDVDKETFAGLNYLKNFNSDIKADSIYYDYWLNGYHHIMLCSDWDTWSSTNYSAKISDAQLAWLDKLLEEDSKNDPDKPVFIMMHEPIYGSVLSTQGGYNNDIDNVEQYKRVLRKYGQVVLFSGHSHSAFDARDNMFNGNEDTPIAFDTSSVADPWNYETEVYTSTSEGYYVRVYKDKVVLLGREFTSHKFMPTALYVIEQQKVSVPKTSYEMKAGDAVTNIDASSSSGAKLTYKSSNEAVAVVDENGNVFPLRAGEAVITVTACATDTKTIARRSVSVTVTDNGKKAADLPYDFYANISIDGKYLTCSRNNVASAVSNDATKNQWRFTKLHNGAYKIYFNGANDLALKQTMNTNGSYTLKTASFDYSSSFSWLIYENEDGSIALQNLANLNSAPISVNIIQTANIENHSFPKSVCFTDGNRCLSISGEIITDDGWHHSVNGKSYYINKNSLVQTGLKFIDGNYYFLNENTGEKEIGWHKALNGKWYYTDSDGILFAEWHKLDGLWYYFSEDSETLGQMQTGMIYSSDAWYYLDDIDGDMKKGWYQNSDGYWYYMDSVGIMQFGWQKLDGLWYYFSQDKATLGQMQTGLICDSGEWYYLGDTDGIMKKGWYQNSDGYWYYIDSMGIIQLGLQEIDGVKYYFSEANDETFGQLQADIPDSDGNIENPDISGGEGFKGFKEIDGETYYFAEDGSMKTGWLVLDGDWYYFNLDGKMHKGMLYNSGAWYYLGDTDGIMKRGWYTSSDGATYYMDDSGVMQFDWLKIDSYWYYFSKERANLGQMHKGILYNSNAWYYLGDTDGIMKRGWYTSSDGATYYLDGVGVMKLGFQEIDGKQYYFSKETETLGQMQKGMLYNSGAWYYLDDTDGSLKTGWYTDSNGATYYMDDSGVMQFDWLKIDSYWYYFSQEEAAFGQMYKGMLYDLNAWYYLGDTDGIMKRGWYTNSAGKTYYLDGVGVMKFGLQEIDGAKYYFSEANDETLGQLQADIPESEPDTSKGTQTAPSAPILESKTHNTVTLKATSGYEYSLDGTEWQTSNVFAGLAPETYYLFYQRKAETESLCASESSDVLVVKTEKDVIESISVSTAPAKQIYTQGIDALDVTGGKVTLHYSYGKTAVIDLTMDMVSGFDNSILGKQSLTVSYDGKTTAFTVIVEAVSDSRFIVDSTAKTMPKVPEKTTLLQLKQFFAEKSVVVKDGDGQIISDNSKYLATGYEVSIDGAKFTVIVKGDVDGDGEIHATDYLRIKSYFLGIFNLDSISFQAADIDENNEIGTTDYLRIKKYMLDSSNLYA